MQGKVDCKLSTSLFKDEVILRLVDVNADLLSTIQQLLQEQQQHLSCVSTRDVIEVSGLMVHVAEFREKIRSLASNCKPRDSPAPQDLLSSLCVAYGARWQHVGTRLGLPNVLLDGIKGFSDDHRMLEVLLTWLGADPEASWSKLASALPEDLNRNDSDDPLPLAVCSLLTRDTLTSFHGLSPDVLGLMQILPHGSIDGVRCLVACGCVLIEGATKGDLDKRIDAFQTAYQDVLKTLQVVSVDCPVKMDASSVGRMVDALQQRYNQCVFTWSPQTHSIRILSNSARQLDLAKQDVAEYLRQSLPSVSLPSHSLPSLTLPSLAAETSSLSRQLEGTKQGGVGFNEEYFAAPLPVPSGFPEPPHIIFGGARILKLKKSNIVHEQVEVIVNAANSLLDHGGGVAGAIDKASCGNVQRQSSALVQQYGPIAVGDVAVTGAGGNLRCYTVYHAVGPDNLMHPNHCQAILQRVMTKVLSLGEEHKMSSMALPAISTGVFGVDRDLVARTMVDTILHHPFKSNAVMTDIRIVIIDDLTFNCFAKYFAEINSGTNLETEAKNMGYDVITLSSVTPLQTAGQPSPSLHTTVASTGLQQAMETETVVSTSSAPSAACREVPLRVNQSLGGTMKVYYLSNCLPGYAHCGMIWISYDIPGGTEGPHHPNPGQQYDGLKARTYLPNNVEGREVLKLLQCAWEAGMTFAIQKGKERDVIAWNIEHKTSSIGGPNQNGYPDQNYLGRVKKQLTGILEECSTV